ncbi:IclR family transcriptional regulator C-terminal domain-containing protein [Martelella sp. HB161492]|uniref:IclR family transcriptional regulator n=1 Tax=Martelella sp. HB161492 TaxID=2720726 RepID=UPI001592449F|nr:IclR family transcriptional regulator C-terminal domain-containing protein [Martelella sp. HB161492]
MNEIAKADRTTASKSEGGVQSIVRALSILDRLAESDEGLTLTELARAVGLPPSSAHRILTTLQRQRFVRFENATMCWLIGVQAFVVGSSFVRSRDVVALAIPHLRRLMKETGETVNFFMLEGEEVMCIAQVQSQQMIRAISRPGGGVEMHRSAAGKAILAQGDDRDVDAVIERTGLPRYTKNTITTPEGLRAELAKIKQLGYSVDNEEFSLGLRCIAAPVFDENGVAYAAVSIAGPASRITEQRVAALGATIMTCAGHVTEEIGGCAKD